MQLSDILEENSIKTISLKTKISEDNLEKVMAKNFEALKKVKTFGFISILEREYKADLSKFREEATEYYSEQGEDKSNTLGVPIAQEKKGNSKFFMLIILSLLAYATWYFVTQFDKKYLSQMIPFIDESTIESFLGEGEVKTEDLDALSIGAVTAKNDEPVAQEEVKTVEQPAESETGEAASQMAAENAEANDASSQNVEVTQTVEDITPVEVTKKTVAIVPENRLWFGIIDMQTNQRDHFSIAERYELDVSEKSWLVATSSAPFSLMEDDETKEFNDAKEHYFKIDANGVTMLDKSEYVALGGWSQW